MSTSALTETQILHFDPAELGLDVDWVLQGQGIDTHNVHAHHPRLVALAENALSEGLSLLQPLAAIRLYQVSSWTHNKANLSPGGNLSGEAIRQHLLNASQIAAVVYSIGGALENKVSSELYHNGAYALALDGLANAATDSLGGLVYHRLEAIAAQKGWRPSIVLSPGMVGWSVEEGQPQLVNLIDPALIGVELTPTWMMKPQKSCSAVLGMGPELESATSLPCDYCTLQGTCRYQGRMHE